MNYAPPRRSPTDSRKTEEPKRRKLEKPTRKTRKGPERPSKNEARGKDKTYFHPREVKNTGKPEKDLKTGQERGSSRYENLKPSEGN